MRAISLEFGGEHVNGADVRSADVFTSQPLLLQGLAAHALEHGINFIDTADTYSSGTLEEMVGQWPKKLGVRREDLLIATKVYGPMGAGPNDAGNSRWKQRMRESPRFPQIRGGQHPSRSGPAPAKTTEGEDYNGTLWVVV